MARRAQVEAGFAGFLAAGLRALAAGLRGAVGLIAIGLPAGAVAASARLGTSELRPAGRRELGFLGDHAGGDAVDTGDFGAAETEGVAGAGLLLFGGVGMARSRQHRDRECRRQHPTQPEIADPKNRHKSPEGK